MSLSPTTLSNGLVAMFVVGSFPPDDADAGQRWTDAYATYATSARSVLSGAPLGIPAKKPALAAALSAAFDARDANTTASAIDSALTAFWLAPPMPFSGGPPAGIVTTVGGTGSLAPALLAVFSDNKTGILSPQDCADAIAAAIDAFTHTVIVLHPAFAFGPIS